MNLIANIMVIVLYSLTIGLVPILTGIILFDEIKNLLKRGEK